MRAVASIADGITSVLWNETELLDDDDEADAIVMSAVIHLANGWDGSPAGRLVWNTENDAFDFYPAIQPDTQLEETK